MDCLIRKMAAKLPKLPLGIGDVDWVAWAPPYDDVPPNPQLRALIPDFNPVFTTDNCSSQRRCGPR